jgi:hypothetical protein
MNCLTGNPGDPLGADPDSGCACERIGDGGHPLTGACTTARPGTGGRYEPGDIVVAAP